MNFTVDVEMVMRPFHRDYFNVTETFLCQAVDTVDAEKKIREYLDDRALGYGMDFGVISINVKPLPDKDVISISKHKHGGAI